MRRRFVLGIVIIVALMFFFLAPVVYRPTGSIVCYASPAYASLSYVVFGRYGGIYTPTAGWYDFPPLSFHNVACIEG